MQLVQGTIPGWTAEGRPLSSLLCVPEVPGRVRLSPSDSWCPDDMGTTPIALPSESRTLGLP